MNMISTGAFLTEMDASNKQRTTAEKFAAVWEKKNAKAARAGGVSLMALSLAACGSSSSDSSSSTSSTTTTTTTTDAAKTITMTKDVIEVLEGGSGDDTFIGDSTTGMVSAADTLKGGAGNDTLKLYSTTTLPTVEAIENLYIKGAIGDLSLASTSYTSIEIDGVATGAAAAETLTLGAGQVVTLDSVTDGDAAAETTAVDGEVELASTTLTTVSVILDDVGGTGTGGDLEVDVAGAKMASITVTSNSTTGGTTAANYVGFQNTGAALKTITVNGDTKLDADENALTGITTLDASAATGAVLFNFTGSTADMTITGGSGDDTFIMGAGHDTDDVIDGGAGTDTINVSSTAFTAATAAAVKAANDVTNIERITTSATTSAITVDFSKLTAVEEFGNSAAMTVATTAVQDQDGGVGITVTGLTSAETLVIGGDITGGTNAASTSDANGGDAINVTPKVDTGNDTLNLLFTAAATVKGGASENDNTGGENHVGGDALDAASIENINITTSSLTSDVTFTAGAASGAAGDTAGKTVSIGANGTITISGAGDVNLGTINAAAGTSADDITVDGSAMTGILTVTTGAGNDVIKGGSKADVLNAGAGTNTVTLGGGRDALSVDDGASNHSTLTTVLDFNAGAQGDSLNFAGGTAVTYETLTAANSTSIAADTTLAAAAAEAVDQLAANEATAFLFGGKAYVLFEDGSNAGTYETDEDALVLLDNVTSLSVLHTDNVT